MAFMYESSTATPRLRPGPNGLPRFQVTEIQRGRMLDAAADAVEEVGYAHMTVAQIISRARVSRKTFYDVFADREDCFLAAFERAITRARLIAREAYDREGGVWREGVRAALGRLLVAMDEEPGLAKMCVVEALAAGERVLQRRAELLEELAALIDQGRPLRSATSEPPTVTAEGVVGGVFAVIHTRLLSDGDEPLTNLLGPLMSMIVLPYLGARAATRELARAAVEVAPRRQAPPRTRNRDPLEGLNMRLTYRTVRVLMVIAERPGASNREIAEGSGIIDQGQISKLLNRLSRLDLVENRGEGQERGAANAWHMTARGTQLERATRPR
ncbi:MAG TPA: TetR family transcriptional regulator [Solirubrobacteraceae bacterium]|jgi:AcrR family transcriptional regulator